MKLAFVAVGLLLAACSANTPDISLAETEYDFGTIPNGEIRTFEIEVRNLGDGDLEILAVTTSCGCTKASVVPTTIGPGSLGMLSVQYDSGAHGPDFRGEVQRQVFIASNDPAHDEIEFRFRADVIGP